MSIPTSSCDAQTAVGGAPGAVSFACVLSDDADRRWCARCVQELFQPSCWSPSSVRQLAYLLSDWQRANPGKPPPELILEDLPAVRVDIYDNQNDQVCIYESRPALWTG